MRRTDDLSILVRTEFYRMTFYGALWKRTSTLVGQAAQSLFQDAPILNLMCTLEDAKI